MMLAISGCSPEPVAMKPEVTLPPAEVVEDEWYVPTEEEMKKCEVKTCGGDDWEDMIKAISGVLDANEVTGDYSG